MPLREVHSGSRDRVPYPGPKRRELRRVSEEVVADELEWVESGGTSERGYGRLYSSPHDLAR